MDRIRFSDRNLLFILGVERSGSTWLANIVDASPAVELFMEPFAETPHLFDGFPDRLTYLEGGDALLEEKVRSQLSELREYKYHGFETRTSSPTVRNLNWALQNLLDRVTGAAGIAQIPARTRYRQLNLNRIDNPETTRFQKTDEPETIAYKELRLNFKVRFLRDLFPEARFLVIVRNPLAQVDSIMRLIDRGSLVQLEGALEALSESIRGTERFGDYSAALEDLVDDRFHRAVAYWFMNYSLMLEDLDATSAEYQIVRHETLSRSPLERARSIYRFAGLPFTDQTRAYVERSSSESTDSSSPTNTTRNSSEYVERRLRNISTERRDRFDAAAERFWELTPEPIAEYRGWLQRELNE